MQAVELGEAPFRIAPETLDPVDVMGATDELVGRMVEPVVLRIAHVDQAVVAAPRIAVQHAPAARPPFHRGAETGATGVRDDLRVDEAVALVDAEDDDLAPRAPP